FDICHFDNGRVRRTLEKAGQFAHETVHREVPAFLPQIFASARNRSTAISTRSGVAGASSFGHILCSATLATASESACSTEIPSMKGGSPTAFERWTDFSTFSDQSASLTLKIFGRS